MKRSAAAKRDGASTPGPGTAALTPEASMAAIAAMSRTQALVRAVIDVDDFSSDELRRQHPAA